MRAGNSWTFGSALPGTKEFKKEWKPVKTGIMYLFIALLAVTAFTGVVTASGDNNHWGVIGEQPSPGADESPGEGVGDSPGFPGEPTPPDAPVFPPRNGL